MRHKARKTPIWVRPAEDRPLFAFAGSWTRWRGVFAGVAAVPLNQTFGLIQLTAAKRPLTDWLLTLALAGNRSDAIEPKARGRPG